MLTPEREATAHRLVESRRDLEFDQAADLLKEIARLRESETETVAALSMARAEIDRLRAEKP
jgi:hypothetical protein